MKLLSPFFPFPIYVLFFFLGIQTTIAGGRPDKPFRSAVAEVEDRRHSMFSPPSLSTHLRVSTGVCVPFVYNRKRKKGQQQQHRKYLLIISFSLAIPLLPGNASFHGDCCCRIPPRHHELMMRYILWSVRHLHIPQTVPSQ